MLLVVQLSARPIPQSPSRFDEAGPRLNVEMIPLDQGDRRSRMREEALWRLHEIDRPFLAAVGGVETDQKSSIPPDEVLPIEAGWNGPNSHFSRRRKVRSWSQATGLPLLFPLDRSKARTNSFFWFRR